MIRSATLPEDLRLRMVVQAHLGFVWRILRNLGVREADLEDETQKVFLVVAEKLASIDPAYERSFLFGTARRVAARSRRTRIRRREDAIEQWPDPVDGCADPERKAQERQSLELLVEVLDSMPEGQRETFILYELEQLTLVEIAEIGGVPLGTVASRLRRARAHFQARVNRLRFECGKGQDEEP